MVSELIQSVEGESRSVIDHMGHYDELLIHAPSKSGPFTSAINSKLIKIFGNDSLSKVKSDKAAAVKIA